MPGEGESWLHSQDFAAQAIKEEQKNKISTRGFVGGVHLLTLLAAPAWMGWDGGSRLVPCLRDGDGNNPSLALFWDMI